MISVTDLPTVNASLNATATFLLATGLIMIKQRRIQAHKVCMGSAAVVSCLFLITYVTYHQLHGFTRFQGEGVIKTIYLIVLVPHTIFAMTLVVLVPLTLFNALKERFDKHRRIARWTLPIWLYVSVTGVIVYWMLYHMDLG